MWSFTEKQTALVPEANAVSDRATSIFINMVEATTQADKLWLLEQYHELNLQEIELLRQAGDPRTEDKLKEEGRRYHGTLKSYQEMQEGSSDPFAATRTPSDEFEAARLAIVREWYKARR